MTGNAAEQSFDRVRPRAAGAAGRAKTTDREGKRALFSEVAAPPSAGSVALDCSKCGARSVVSMATLWRVAFPAVPAVVPGHGVRANMKCPACGERSWLTVSLRHKD
jgi:ribosomal protein S27AE